MCLADNSARSDKPVFRGAGIGQLLRQLEGYMVSPDLSRFLDHVSIEGSQIPGMMLCCWPWTGAVDGKGRPRFYLDGSGRLARRREIDWDDTFMNSDGSIKAEFFEKVLQSLARPLDLSMFM